MGELFFISDEAYDGIVRLSIHGGFTPLGARRAAGLSDFLSVLPYMNFRDERPDYVKQRAAYDLAHKKLPEWRSLTVRGFTKKPRYLDLIEDSMYEYTRVAIAHGIILPDKVLRGAPTTPVQITSRVIEAIGLGFLVPERVPRKVILAGLQQVAT